MFSELSVVKSEDRTMEVAEEIESSEATGEPEMQPESKALAVLNAEEPNFKCRVNQRCNHKIMYIDSNI